MAFVGADPSFDFEPQRLKSLSNFKVDAEIKTIRNKSKFDFDLATWKSNTLFNAHTPLPPERLVKPNVYLVVTVDEEKHRQRFTEYWNNGLVQLVYDFYVEKVADLPADTWDLTPKNPEPPKNDVNPIGKAYAGFGPGVFQHAGGQEWNDGDKYFDAANGKFFTVHRLRDNPFNQGFKNFAWTEDGVGKINPTALFQ